MQVFIPYASPYKSAHCLYGDRRFQKQILECRQILAALNDMSKGYANHPVVKMYRGHERWLSLYLKTFELIKDGNDFLAKYISHLADMCRPVWMTVSLCDQHKRRLYTKRPDLYSQFADLGKSSENWYVVNGETLRYSNGKRILENIL